MNIRGLDFLQERAVKDVIADGFKLYVKAILAGMMVGLSGFMYLLQSNTVFGSLLFAIGLLSVLALNLPLFTNTVGYLWHDEDVTITKLVITWIGNLIGTNLMSYLVIPTAMYKRIDMKVDLLVTDTVAGTFVSIFCLSVICGMFMFIAAEAHRSLKDVRGSLVSILATVGFLSVGALHSIANMFYIYVCRNTYLLNQEHADFRPLIVIFIMTLGNAVGAEIVSTMSFTTLRKTFFN